ncbi:D-alanine--D-alanine ligase [Emticicia sp. CRIBPO]|uniref:D-alanine--D-alanine ligase family protein n=1 Tax=Emticicia sp. CRIBPO TaxID=2683258 RepID=UPI001412FFC6|nr:D-alanine--D-alanine ligase [Emticicia sp. CRIBPO]NBA86164.1 D-alanine--D-alanine ligase [Emticicia sp. CRIBPO]
MDKKIKVGIFFGGQSREREISFLGGKTAFEHIDRRLFDPIPIFVDSIGNFIQVDPEILYEEDIRSFYPSKNHNNGYRIYIESLGKLRDTQLYKLIYKIGSQIKPEKFHEIMDFAFIVMHGPYAEDGNIQGLLEWHGIPYMGPGLLGSAVGINKPKQNKLMASATGQKKKFCTISKDEWEKKDKSDLFSELINDIGFPFVVKAPHQGSSIGVAIIKKRSLEEFTKGMSQCFFETTFYKKEWDRLTQRQKKNQMEKMSNLDEGIGFPVVVKNEVIYHPQDLLKKLDLEFQVKEKLAVSSLHSEDYVMIEEYISGQEFSCGVIQDDSGKAYALPPTEVYGDISTFNFKSKYQSTATRKRIPVDTHFENLNKIHENILKVFEITGLSVIGRIDGFLTAEDEVILHDPNTIPGMSPTSFIFKQMAEIGFNITNTITYLIRQSIRERIKSGKETFLLRELLKKADSLIESGKKAKKKNVAVVFGENEEEYKVAQKKYGQLGADPDFNPVPVCAAGNGNMYSIPLNLMFKAGIQEFGESVGKQKHPFVAGIIENTKPLREKYVGEVDFEVKKLDKLTLSANFDLLFDSKTGTTIEI